MAGEQRIRTNANSESGGGAFGASEPWVLFGARVRAARENAGLSLQQLGRGLFTDPREVRQIEDGDHIPGLRTAMTLDRELGAEGVLWDAWAQTYITIQLKAGTTAFGLMYELFQLRAYAPLMIPEPFLTSEYATALDRIERPLESHDRIKDRPRIGDHTRSGGPPYFCLILDKAVLTRVVVDPEVTQRQLQHLLTFVTGRRVALHVIPEDATHHPGLRGAFWTMSFSPRHTLAYTPHPRGPGHLVTDAVQIKGYADLFATLQSVALPAHESLRLLEQAVDRMTESATHPRPSEEFGPTEESGGYSPSTSELGPRALTSGSVPVEALGN
ncbi:transcriptional regulator with XRE-family HTH domain [Nocardiopsis arvandica]|uniref:Transcriptional regulator with XRE-family HTH domain n=1 Tax=Nocardiopsis sinuspersici TaxID=501010 RepID=A0A7Y9X8M1_9ACTN|nr:helix-turn-helix transcriptional regulator [Nocardiopsis sinuspersici]NYH50442.1 transcriptional regulator with XRE-family HTH domain [Nocardiopsis sinuspersici]